MNIQSGFPASDPSLKPQDGLELFEGHFWYLPFSSAFGLGHRFGFCSGFRSQGSGFRHCFRCCLRCSFWSRFRLGFGRCGCGLLRCLHLKKRPSNEDQTDRDRRQPRGHCATTRLSRSRFCVLLFHLCVVLLILQFHDLILVLLDPIFQFLNGYVLLVWFCWGRCGRFRFQSFRRRLRGFAGLRRFTGLCSGCITRGKICVHLVLAMIACKSQHICQTGAACVFLAACKLHLSQRSTRCSDPHLNQARGCCSKGSLQPGIGSCCYAGALVTNHQIYWQFVLRMSNLESEQVRSSFLEVHTEVC
mmetsp:Transcript_59237/g.129966  ORF Transcript_59237/g.129966 Transcript_59237/m.129966 type:complete len:303 (-) Transcript_59237:637-1545(-)